jgi:hypothetical protein
MSQVASVGVQWKGTDVCLDFVCSCGQEGHFDGYGAYALKCPKCESVFEMPMHWSITSGQVELHKPVLIKRDEDQP